MTRPRVGVVLAAGKGTRMGSALPKVLHEVAGRPLLEWVLETARRAECERILVVVGHGAAEVERALGGATDIELVLQREQRGTGHAVACVEGRVAREALLLVLSGDVPLLRAATARELLAAAESAWGAMAVADLEEPGALGRVTVSPDGALVRSVEYSDATAEERAGRTINAGIYALPAGDLFQYLGEVTSDNAQGELYLPDALNLAAARGRRVVCLRLADASEALGVNTPAELARVEAVIAKRKRSR